MGSESTGPAEGLRPVQAVIPHRPPFLFIDEVVDLTDTKVVARRVVRADEPQFEGHYPGRPIMPGVLLSEAVLQAGAYLVATRLGLGADMEGSPVVSRMNKVRFKRMVKPGDELVITAQYKRSMMGAHLLSGAIRCQDKLVCTLEFMVMLVPEEPE